MDDGKHKQSRAQMGASKDWAEHIWSQIRTGVSKDRAKQTQKYNNQLSWLRRKIIRREKPRFRRKRTRR